MKTKPLQTDLNLSTLVELLNYRAQTNPGIKAYTFLADGEIEQGHLTYDDLDRQARAIGAHLHELKAVGERVLLIYPTGLEFIAAFFGCLYAGAIAVPVYPPRAKENMLRLQAVVDDAQITLAMTNTSLSPKIKARLDKTTGMTGIHLLNTDDIDPKNCSNFEKTVVNSNDLALIQYTSGSTGRPKGVMVNHQNLLHNQQIIKQAVGCNKETISVGWLPQFHDFGLIGQILQPLFLGCPHIFMSPVAFLQKPSRWLQTISDYKATASGGPNFAYDLCVKKISPEQRTSLDLTSWQVAFVGAEPVRAETLDQFSTTFGPHGFRHNAFYPCYGLAEATLIVSGGKTSTPPLVQIVGSTALSHNHVQTSSDSQRNTRKLVGCGQAWLNQKILIVDPESFKQVPADRVGEIWVSGPSVAQGFLNQVKETTETFRAFVEGTKEGPFLRTGDFGFIRENELFITGRLKDLIIIGGQNHYPQDIELTVQESHRALRPGCGGTFSVDQASSERLVIAQEVEHRFLKNLDVKEIIRAIQQAVSEQHGIQVYAILLLKPASIPKTSSGKIRRQACRLGFLEETLDIVGQWIEHSIDHHGHQEHQTNEKTFHLHKSNSHHIPSSSFGKPVPNVASELKKNTPTQTDIQDWLVSQLSTYLEVPQEKINIQIPTAQYGLDSSVAVTLTGQLSIWLDLKLEPTLFWEFPSIEGLATYLSKEVQRPQSTSQDIGNGKH